MNTTKKQSGALIQRRIKFKVASSHQTLFET
jgi:hypothetical protein